MSRFKDNCKLYLRKIVKIESTQFIFSSKEVQFIMFLKKIKFVEADTSLKIIGEILKS